MESLRKTERLSDRKVIAQLFEANKKIQLPGFVVFWDDRPAEAKFRMLISASKKKIPHAVDRNYIKRVIRESIRKNRTPFTRFLETRGAYCTMAIVYTGREKPSYSWVNAKILLILRRLQVEYEKVSS